MPTPVRFRSFFTAGLAVGIAWLSVVAGAGPCCCFGSPVVAGRPSHSCCSARSTERGESLSCPTPTAAARTCVSVAPNALRECRCEVEERGIAPPPSTEGKRLVSESGTPFPAFEVYSLVPEVGARVERLAAATSALSIPLRELYCVWRK